MKRWDERAICSSLSMNRMAKMPEMLEPIGRPSVWRKMRSSKVKYMLLSVTLSSSATSGLDRWNVLCPILSPDGVVDGFLDGYGCVQGYYVQAAWVRQCLIVVVRVPILYAFDKFVAVLKVCWNAC